MSLDSRLTINDPRPGRSCPLSYGYAPASLARDPEIVADTLYVVGGLYGNRSALASLLDLARAERGHTVVVFNGDFNWFNVDPEAFESVNRIVLEHVALRGNVETELADDDSSAGCGCGYPNWVDDTQVARSNAIINRLRDTSRAYPELRARLRQLPATATARVGDSRVAIVHGDAESLAGWGFSQETLDDPRHRDKIAQWFDAARVHIFASSHTCLPVMCGFGRGRVLVNNGAAGMPNFLATRYGIITRISALSAQTPGVLYSSRIGDTQVAALPVHYDTARFEREFLLNWSEGSPAHASYFQRITRGPDYSEERATRQYDASSGRDRLSVSRQEIQI